MFYFEGVKSKTCSLFLNHLSISIYQHSQPEAARLQWSRSFPMQPGVDWGLTQFWLRMNFSGIGIGMGRRKERRPWHQVLQVLQKLCPHVARMHLCMTWPDTFFPLSRFREVTHLSIYRVASVENFDLPLMAFGPKLVKLELTNCTNFQSGTALNIRKYYSEYNSENFFLS